MTGNPISQMLDAHGIPWRDSQSALAERFATMPDPVGAPQPAVPIGKSGSFLPHLLNGLFFRPSSFADQSLPPLLLHGHVLAPKRRLSSVLRSWPMVSLQEARSALEPVLGRPERRASSNTRGLYWRFGSAWIELESFPPGLNRTSLGDPPPMQDPRVERACSVSICTGYRPALSNEEDELLRAYSPRFELGPQLSSESMEDSTPSQHLLEYVRDPRGRAGHVRGTIGRGDDGTVIFGTDQLYLVPAGHVMSIEVERFEPGRISGYAQMYLRCGRSPAQSKVISLSYAEDPDGLNSSAEQVAEWLGCDLVFKDCGANY